MPRQKEGSMQTFETYKHFDDYDISNLTQKEPRAFNGELRVKRYKVTIEEVSTIEEECDAIQKLWDDCDNHHHYTPIRNYAKKIGYELKEKSRNQTK